MALQMSAVKRTSGRQSNFGMRVAGTRLCLSITNVFCPASPPAGLVGKDCSLALAPRDGPEPAPGSSRLPSRPPAWYTMRMRDSVPHCPCSHTAPTTQTAAAASATPAALQLNTSAAAASAVHRGLDFRIGTGAYPHTQVQPAEEPATHPRRLCRA